MRNALKSSAKQCCTREHERLIQRLADCDEHTVTAAGKHACYRQAAGTSGRRSKRCIADARA